MAIFTFQSAWNDFLAPLIFLDDQSLYTLQLGLSLFRGLQRAVSLPDAQFSGCHLPVIVLFFFTRRSFIEGVGFGRQDKNSQGPF